MSKMNTNEKLVYRHYLDRENGILRNSYSAELDFYDFISSGDTENLKKRLQTPLSEVQGLGSLSDNSLQNIKYHFVITTSMVARYCIEKGLPMTEAYDLSDYYIRSCDEAPSAKEINRLHREMCLEYCDRMNELMHKSVSGSVSAAIDYIYDNLHTRIHITDVANSVSLSPAYLSRLFKSETGITLTDYIRQKKIQAAKGMLQHSSFTPAEISDILAFPGQSYFTEVFRKETGLTPLKYKQQKARKLL